MLQTLDRASDRRLPQPRIAPRRRSQLEAYFVLRRNPLELWGEAAYEDGILPGRFLGRQQVMLNEPGAIRHVLVDNADNYRRTISTHRILQPVLGSGLFLAEGQAWRHQRRTIAPAMAPRSMAVLARHVVTECEPVEAALAADARPVELLRTLQHLALEIAARSMFSLETAGFGAELRSMLMRYAQGFAQPSFLDLLLPRTMRSPTDIRRAEFRKDWLKLIDRVIDQREAQTRPGDGPRDLFDMLAGARDPETGAGFDRAQLRDEVATMILAGHETTAVTLFWSCYCAARMPEHQARIAAEAEGVDLSADGAAAAIRSLPFTRAFIDEALRLYPPAFLIVREAKAADRIGEFAVAPGTVVSISPWVLHRHRALWRDPAAFDPNRFLPGAPPPDRYAYMPFGAGPRICVGAQFALTEAVIVLARLLRRFQLEFSGSGAVVPRGMVTTQPDRPVRFILRARS